MNAVIEPLPLPTERFRVYEATDPFHPRPYRLALSVSREKTLVEDISTGRKLLRLGRMLLETRDAALACANSDALAL